MKKRELTARIEKALAYAADLAKYDGDHHKMYCVDQMVRALTGCPTGVVTKTATSGQEYTYEKQGESDEYVLFKGCASEWDDGIAP